MFKLPDACLNLYFGPAGFLKCGRAALCELRRINTGAVFIAIGKSAERALAEAGIESVCTVRHPANGGATAFANGLALAAGRSGQRDR